MGDLLLELLPSAIGLALTPTAIVACVLFKPEATQAGLATLRDWLVARQRQLNRAVLLVFGLGFTIKGFAGL
jgi:hypothetical protein